MASSQNFKHALGRYPKSHPFMRLAVCGRLLRFIRFVGPGEEVTCPKCQKRIEREKAKAVLPLEAQALSNF